MVYSRRQFRGDIISEAMVRLLLTCVIFLTMLFPAWAKSGRSSRSSTSQSRSSSTLGGIFTRATGESPCGLIERSKGCSGGDDHERLVIVPSARQV